MQLKRVSTFILLFVIYFSVFHEIEFTLYDKEPCNVVEYVSEFDAPTDCGDICEIHYEYHHAYVLPFSDTIAYLNVGNFYNIPQNTSYHFKNHSKSVKPPVI